MQSLFDKARELGRELAQTPEYKALEEKKRQVEEHAAAKIMYEDFAKKQRELEKARAEGKTPSENQMEALKKSYEIMSFNPYIRELLMAEYEFAKLMTEVQKAMGEEIGVSFPDMPEIPEETTP